MKALNSLIALILSPGRKLAALLDKPPGEEGMGSTVPPGPSDPDFPHKRPIWMVLNYGDGNQVRWIPLSAGPLIEMGEPKVIQTDETKEIFTEDELDAAIKGDYSDKAQMIRMLRLNLASAVTRVRQLMTDKENMPVKALASVTALASVDMPKGKAADQADLPSLTYAGKRRHFEMVPLTTKEIEDIQAKQKENGLPPLTEEQLKRIKSPKWMSELDVLKEQGKSPDVVFSVLTKEMIEDIQEIRKKIGEPPLTGEQIAKMVEDQPFTGSYVVVVRKSENARRFVVANAQTLAQYLYPHPSDDIDLYLDDLLPDGQRITGFRPPKPETVK